jgi:hypothetical protein
MAQDDASDTLTAKGAQGEGVSRPQRPHPGLHRTGLELAFGRSRATNAVPALSRAPRP